MDSIPGVVLWDNLGIPESGDGIPDVLQEAKWEADFLAKMQDADAKKRESGLFARLIELLAQNAVMMLGGMDSLLGAVVGGVVIGELLSFGQYYIGGLVQIVIFLIIGVVLYFRPNGILGRGIDIGI